MRILIYGINFTPELTGIGKYTGDMAEWLSAEGHSVRVVTAPPYYPQWKVADAYRGGYRKEDQVAHDSTQTSVGGLTVYRCPLWVPASPSGLKRVIHLASFALSSLPVLLWQVFWRPQVVLVVEPPLFCAPQAWLVSRLSGGKAWLHIQDFELDAAFDLGLLRGGRLRRLATSVESRLMRAFDRVSTISSRMLDRVYDKGVEKGKAILLRNWVDVDAIAPAIGPGDIQAGSDGESGYRAELNIPESAVVALYAGNMGAKQGLEILAEAAKILSEPFSALADRQGGTDPDSSEICFVFCGNGAGRAELFARCEGLRNVRFLDLQPTERLGELLRMADIHLLPQRADAADLVMPSKLTGILASGRPVVATAARGTEVASVVEGSGLVVEPEDPKAFANAIVDLAQHPLLREELGAKGRAYAERHLDRRAVLERLGQLLEEVVVEK